LAFSTAGLAKMSDVKRHVVSEIQLLSWNEMVNLAEGSIVVSPDSRHVAYVVKTQAGMAVVLDGQRVSEHREILFDPVFSPDSQRLAYVAVLDQGMAVIVDGKVGPTYKVVYAPPVFSGDSKHLAYTARLGDDWYVLVDDNAYATYHERDCVCGVEGNIVLNSDASRVGYKRMTGQFSDLKKSFVIDGVESPAYRMLDTRSIPGIDGIVFSKDGKQVVVAQKTPIATLLVRDGKRWHLHLGIAQLPVFSTDGRRTSYVAIEEGQVVVFVDEVEIGRFEGFHKQTPTFSADGRRFAVAVREHGRWFVIVDGKVGKRYDYVDVGNDIFSKDGSTFAYLAVDGEKKTVVINDIEYNAVGEDVAGGSLALGPNGKHVAYVVKLADGKQSVVLDGK
jgi:WD40-like Beta Propeller Repeat